MRQAACGEGSAGIAARRWRGAERGQLGQEGSCARMADELSLGTLAHNLIPAGGEVKSAVPPFDTLFAAWRVDFPRDLEVVRGTLRPGLHPRDAAVREALAAWPGTADAAPGPFGWHLLLVRRAAPRPRERWWLHAALLLATLASTTFAGALLAGYAPDPWILPLGPLEVPLPAELSVAGMARGLSFSLPLLAILLAHEMGHYVLARRRMLDASPPWFVPVPWLLSLIGTLGAFIRLRSPLPGRAALLDVGAAGPLAGALVALPVTAAGLALSTPAPRLLYDGAPAVFLAVDGAPQLVLGQSLLFKMLAAAFAPDGVTSLLLHPTALAGWVGLLFTTLNLLPVSQLDGGHVVYALVGGRQRWIGAAMLAALLALGFAWPGWWLWAGLILVVGRGRLAHPPVLDDAFPLDPARRAVAWACIALFLLTFVPVLAV